MLTDEQAFTLIRTHVEAQFPKSCARCGRKFRSLAEYVRQTRYVGEPISADAELADPQPDAPLGTFGLSNCPCGNTLALSSDGIGIITMGRLLRWGQLTSHRRGITPRRLLAEIREAVDQDALRRQPRSSE